MRSVLKACAVGPRRQRIQHTAPNTKRYTTPIRRRRHDAVAIYLHRVGRCALRRLLSASGTRHRVAAHGRSAIQPHVDIAPINIHPVHARDGSLRSLEVRELNDTPPPVA
jgi:hypothetical protein